MLVPTTIPAQEQVTASSCDGFEGPEKLLELWFTIDEPIMGDPMTQGLRAIPREEWKKVLEVVQCQILNVVSNQYLDAYLLSESSLFVYPTQIILKTCGITTLLHALPQIIKLAYDVANASHIEKLFYSRKCFIYPEKQLWPHKSWDQEVKVLDVLFAKGSAYTLGKLNGDHWNLYVGDVQRICPEQLGIDILTLFHRRGANGKLAVADNASTIRPPIFSGGYHFSGNTCSDGFASETENHITGNGHYASGPDSTCSNSSSNDIFDGEEDQTLEIMMRDLDPEKCKVYFAAQQADGKAKGSIERQSGLDQIYGPICEELGWDSFLFEPCGYSLNILPTSLGPYYATVHITPEAHCSYASFETNVPIWKSHFARESNLAGRGSRSPSPEDVFRNMTGVNGQGRHGGKRSSIKRHAAVRKTLTRSYANLVAQVVGIFNPGQFTFTLFRSRKKDITCTSPYLSISEVLDGMTDRDSCLKARRDTYDSGGKSAQKVPPDKSGGNLSGDSASPSSGMRDSAIAKRDDQDFGDQYRQTDKIVHEFEDYELIFYSWTKI